MVETGHDAGRQFSRDGTDSLLARELGDRERRSSPRGAIAEGVFAEAWRDKIVNSLRIVI